MKYLTLTVAVFSLLSCKKDSPEKPVGTLQSKAVYNNAYIENYKADQITDIIANAHNAYVLIDPFENNAHASIADIKTNGNEVGGYISIGTAEDWRADYNDLKPYCVSKQWGDWAGEYFVDVTTTGVIDVMKARIDQMADWGCDWVEFDNMDWAFDDKNRSKYDFHTSEAEGIAYYQELCDYVHFKGMKCMSKNIRQGAENFDGVLYESFPKNMDWWDHDGAQKFIDEGKLVIINHYEEKHPNNAYQKYIDLYNNNISFICESKKDKKYIHYNE